MRKDRNLMIVNMLHNWTDKYFSDQEAVLLLIFLVGGITFVVATGSILAPLYASIIIGYLLHGGVDCLAKYRCPKWAGITITYSIFLAIYIASFFLLLPLVWRQMTNLFFDLPSMVMQAQATIDALLAQYPILSADSGDALSSNLVKNIQGWSKTILTASISSIPDIISWLIYLILVPFLVFFFMKDSTKILTWCLGFLPRQRSLLHRVWTEVNDQIGNYVRGKAIEIAVIGITCYLIFIYFDLHYAVLLSVLVGLSVVIPFVGATVVTIPVALVAFLQFGLGDECMYLSLAYFILHAIDGNLLVPILFSEAVSLHPVAIILAILVFGALWGFWGIFFAIPLATLVKSVIYAWPVRNN